MAADAGRAPSRMVWLVIKEGVYDHGCHYVAESLEDAEKFCAEWASDTDGYHDWRIDPTPIGEPHNPEGGLRQVAD